MIKKRIYLDNAATTKLCKEAFEKMTPFFIENYGNPSGTYEEGITARCAVNEARHIIAKSLSCYDKEIIFTAGGSEADNFAIIGIMEANIAKGRHLITTKTEHHAILESCKYLEKKGFRITYLNVNKEGFIDLYKLKDAICEDTVLVSVMYANNEIGSVQNIKEIGKICKENNLYFHTDAVQAYGKLMINPKELNIDLLSASAHKFNGPKGAGFLYVKAGTKINSFIHGGTQEYKLRAGTENVASIVGMGEASRIAFENLSDTQRHEENLKEHFWNSIKNIKDIKLNGTFENSLPNILNVCIKGIEGESLVINLDMDGISASTGSACAISLEEPSHVLRAIGLTHEEARASVRFSFARENTIEDLDYVAERLIKNVEYLRGLNG